MSSSARLQYDFKFFATNHGKSPCSGVGGYVKCYVAKRSLQRPLHDQILGNQPMLDLCIREISSITFFGVSQEEMVNFCADLEDHFLKSKSMPGKMSSHHFVPISCNKIAHKLKSEDREFLQFDFDKSFTKEIDIKKHQVFFTCQLYLQYILVGWHSDWSECTWRCFEDWISSPTGT